MLNYLKDYFKDWNLWDYSWTIIASIAGTWIGLQWGSWLSVVTMLTGLWCVILVAKGRIFNYYLGLIQVVTYAYICYGYQLYGEFQLNIFYFLPMQFVGLYIWHKNKDTSVKDKVIVKFLTNQQRVAWTLISLTAVSCYAVYLEGLADPYPIIDSTSTVLSVIAMVLMAWRYMEQWILWIVVDIVSVWMWVLVVMNEGANDIALLVMWIAFLINAVYGFIMWIKMYKDQQIEDVFLEDPCCPNGVNELK